MTEAMIAVRLEDILAEIALLERRLDLEKIDLSKLETKLDNLKPLLEKDERRYLDMQMKNLKDAIKIGNASLLIKGIDNIKRFVLSKYKYVTRRDGIKFIKRVYTGALEGFKQLIKAREKK